MSVETFQKLDVWQKGHALTLQIYKESIRFPVQERFGLVVQIRRSCSSICANIVEGYKKSDKEFVRYLSIAEASLEETKYHLILAKDLNYLKTERFDQLFAIANEVGRMINGLARKIKTDLNINA